MQRAHGEHRRRLWGNAKVFANGSTRSPCGSAYPGKREFPSDSRLSQVLAWLERLTPPMCFGLQKPGRWNLCSPLSALRQPGFIRALHQAVRRLTNWCRHPTANPPWRM